MISYILIIAHGNIEVSEFNGSKYSLNRKLLLTCMYNRECNFDFFFSVYGIGF
jgi:hypothetical protein